MCRPGPASKDLRYNDFRTGATHMSKYLADVTTSWFEPARLVPRPISSIPVENYMTLTHDNGEVSKHQIPACRLLALYFLNISTLIFNHGGTFLDVLIACNQYISLQIPLVSVFSLCFLPSDILATVAINDKSSRLEQTASPGPTYPSTLSWLRRMRVLRTEKKKNSTLAQV